MSRTPAPSSSTKAPAAQRPPKEDPDRAKEHAAAEEIAGRHKNAGQKDHKGARSRPR